MAREHRNPTLRFACAALLAFLSATVVTGLARADVEISSKPTQNMNCSGGVCTATAKKAVLNVGDLATMLSSGDVAVASGSLAANIEISAALSWTSTSRLTLDAQQSVTVKKPIMVAGTGALTITTNDGGKNGDLLIADKARVTFWDLNSSLIINGNGYTLVGDLATLAGDIALNQNGFFALANDYDAKKDESSKTRIKFFWGTFEGLGQSISNLKVRRGYKHLRCEGLFGIVYSGATVRDIDLKNVDISSPPQQPDQNVGALAGCNDGTIFNASSTGKVRGVHNTGGLVGLNQWRIVGAHSAASVSGGNAGGLVGENDSGFEQSYATGSVSGGVYTGGLVGFDDLNIVNCYATGPVAGKIAGGLTGFAGYFVQTSYSTGTVSGTVSTGGFVGDAGGSIAMSYWDLDTSGISDPSQGAGDFPNYPGITGLTDTQLKSGLPDGFDPAIWGQNPNINNGYPYLLANPPQ